MIDRLSRELAFLLKDAGCDIIYLPVENGDTRVLISMDKPFADEHLEKTREMATKEAEVIINTSKDKAIAESTKIAQEGDAKLSEMQSKIDANFDEAVKHVVSTVLKA